MIAKAEVLASKHETPTVHTLRIAKPRGFDFRPVQFVGLEFDTDEGSIEYPMSLACSPTRPYLEFGARISDSPWKRAFASLEPGDVVEVDGPYGHFVLDEARPAVLVAGGIGITPLKGMLEYATDQRLAHDVVLLYSNKTPEETAYKSELDALARANPRARLAYTVTQRAGPGWQGRRGRIDGAMLREAAQGLRDPAYYVCGKPAMVEGAVRMLWDMGIPRDRVLWEQFTGYA